MGIEVLTFSKHKIIVINFVKFVVNYIYLKIDV